MNVKAHIRATEDIQNNQTDGGALCDASCSASSFDSVEKEKALKAVELVNKMRDKYNEAGKYPKDSVEYTKLFNEGKEYLAQLQLI